MNRRMLMYQMITCVCMTVCQAGLLRRHCRMEAGHMICEARVLERITGRYIVKGRISVNMITLLGVSNSTYARMLLKRFTDDTLHWSCGLQVLNP